jgi:hypothetical protein
MAKAQSNDSEWYLTFTDATVQQLQELHDILWDIASSQLYDIEQWVAGDAEFTYFPDGWHFISQSGRDKAGK